MRQAIYIFKKEFEAYFLSPIAYIVITLFLLVTGWFFFSGFFIYDRADLRNFFNLLPIVFSFMVPAITMRLYSEELNVGSYEILLTMPVTYLDVIVGKFLAAVTFIAVMLVPTFAYPISISFIGDLDWGPVMGGYIGGILLGAAYSAIGICASSLTRNQIIAFMIGMSICFVLTIINKMLFFFPQTMLNIIGYLSADNHFQNIAKGILDSRDLLYFLSIIFVGLYSTHLVMQEKR
jgi:ABC-2 type transport system permease protein